MNEVKIKTPHGLHHTLDRELEDLRSALFAVTCAKSSGSLSLDAEVCCQKAAADIERAYRDFEVVTRVYVARARMAGIPTLRLALHLATEELKRETDPDRIAARRMLQEQTDKLLQQRTQVLNTSILDVHAADIARFRAAIGTATRRIDDAIRPRASA